MNARQKIKKLKKELDYIKSQPFREVCKINVTDIPTEHLRVYRVIPIEQLEKYGVEIIENEVRLQLSRDLMNFLNAKIIVNKDRDIDRFNTIKYSTDIWVGFGRR